MALPMARDKYNDLIKDQGARLLDADWITLTALIFSVSSKTTHIHLQWLPPF